MSENEIRESCYDPKVESGAVTDHKVSEETVLSNESAENVNVSLAETGKEPDSNASADVFEKSFGDGLQVSEHEVHTTPRPLAPTDRRRKRQGTVIWEPLLVPSEVDGKVEMVTALKRVDSDYISSPRTNMRMTGAQILKESASQEMKMRQTSIRIGPPTKAGVLKGTPDPSVKHIFKKEITKRKTSDINISEQMGRAIAEKEAAILKEIEKAMKEANAKSRSVSSQPDLSVTSTNKSVVSGDQCKSNTLLKVVQTQDVKNKIVENTQEVFNDPERTKDSLDSVENLFEGEKDHETKTNTSAKKRILTTQSVMKSGSSPSVDVKELQGLSKISTVQGKLAAVSSSVARPLTKESQSVSKVLAVPRTVVSATQPALLALPKDVHAINKVVGGTGTLLASSAAVITTHDAHTLNQIITVPVNTKSNPHTLKEMSPTAPTILLLAAPNTALSAGNLPLLTPLIPATNIPIIQTPIRTSSRSVSSGKVDIQESTKDVGNRERRVRNLGGGVPEASTESTDSEPINFGYSDVCDLGKGQPIRIARAESNKNSSVSNEQLPDITQKPSSSSEITKPSSEVKKLTKHKTPFPCASPRGLKNNLTQSRERVALTIPVSESETIEPTGKQERLKMTNNASDATVEDKTAGISAKQSSQAPEKDSQRMDYNGENMDIDDESISEEMDQGFVDDTKNVLNQDLVTREAKRSSSAKESKSHSRGRTSLKTSSKNSAQNKSMDLNSDILLENRLQKIEQLYNEIPPVKPRISLSGEDFSKIRDGFRDSMRVVKEVTASFKNLISQSHSLRGRGFVHSSSQTEMLVENDTTDDVPGGTAGDKSEVVDANLIVCRLCGEFFKKNSVIFLFGELSKKKKLLSMLTTILPTIPVKEFDGLPQQVCEACVNKLTLCHTIIIQFLKADKELRQVLQDEKPFASDTSCLEENQVAISHEDQGSPEQNPSTSVENILETEPHILEGLTDAKKKSNKECAKTSEQSPLERRGEKRSQSADSVRSCSENSTPNHKHKRRRSKSPHRSESVDITKSSVPSKSSSACIDLSRLDPEFNDGFEVEWCLDEETIRSSLIPEEDVGHDLNEDSAVASVHVTEDTHLTESEVRGGAEFPSGILESHPSASSPKKDKDNQGNKPSKFTVEVSKLPEMHSSVCESPVKSESGTKQSSVSTIHQEKCDVQPNAVSQLRETFKCPSCSLSFNSKQEAFLHKVMQHEEELTDVMRPEGKQDITSTVETESLSQKQSLSLDPKIECESSEASIMCDQCGLPFPNENSLHIHKCAETSVDPQLVIKDSKELECKILHSEQTDVESEQCQVSESPLTEGKILVKCGQGMLWVNCSKFFTDAQLAALQSSDLGGITYVNIEDDTSNNALSEHTVSNVSTQSVSIPKVQFAYKCDHCKKIFPGKSELLTHLETHLTEEFNCDVCSTKFPTMKALNSHIPTHIPPDRVCDECGLILSDSKKQLQHRKEHTHNLPHVCGTCGKRFPNEQTLEVHETVHYSKKGPLACSLCRKCFFFKHSLVRHRSQHASNRLQKCSLCFRVLNSSDQLRKHVALHHLMKNFVCFCKQTFPSQKELVEHRYLKHSYAEIFCARNKVEIIEPLPLHQCSTCLRVLNSKQSLMKHHVASHSSMWPFYCILCSRKYKSMSYLTKHECHRRNTSAFQCRICGKAFQNKNIFNQHKVIHNNRKWRYICRHCGKAFQKSQSLVSHIMTHGGKRFLCPRCRQPCQNKEGLLKHYNTGSCQMKGKSLQ